ncbi:MAG: hypothetical protein EBY74_05650, partial [Actinobacteria bacterium]|nr:hypothetical protein [Actinomycetota bacterium]
MNLNHLEAIAVTQKLAYSLEDRDFDKVEVAVFPPFTDLRSVQTLVDGDRLRLSYGAQDLSPEKPGAFTGDIAGTMLEKLGCTYVIVGHSERRAIHGENDETLYRKDADINEINNMMRDPDGYCKIWREFQTVHKPKYWVVWPHS